MAEVISVVAFHTHVLITHARELVLLFLKNGDLGLQLHVLVNYPVHVF
jgi:hypothetical protein